MTADRTAAPTDRRAELAANLAALRARVAAACERAGRDPAAVAIIAITKTYPASDIALLAELGITDVGENRDQEAAPKAAACSGRGLTWHFVGQLQTNKARSVATYADVVHSVDRARLVRALDAAAGTAGRRLGCLIQVDLDPAAGTDTHAGRGGAAPAAVPELAAAVAAASSLDLRGVMAVAPLGADPAPAFRRLAAVAADLVVEHPDATAMSAGMSGDLEAAIAAGATHLRVGAALLGPRPHTR